MRRKHYFFWGGEGGLSQEEVGNKIQAKSDTVLDFQLLNIFPDVTTQDINQSNISLYISVKVQVPYS